MARLSDDYRTHEQVLATPGLADLCFFLFYHQPHVWFADIVNCFWANEYRGHPSHLRRKLIHHDMLLLEEAGYFERHTVEVKVPLDVSSPLLTWHVDTPGEPDYESIAKRIASRPTKVVRRKLYVPTIKYLLLFDAMPREHLDQILFFCVPYREGTNFALLANVAQEGVRPNVLMDAFRDKPLLKEYEGELQDSLATCPYHFTDEFMAHLERITKEVRTRLDRRDWLALLPALETASYMPFGGLVFENVPVPLRTSFRLNPFAAINYGLIRPNDTQFASMSFRLSQQHWNNFIPGVTSAFLEPAWHDGMPTPSIRVVDGLPSPETLRDLSMEAFPWSDESTWAIQRRTEPYRRWKSCTSHMVFCGIDLTVAQLCQIHAAFARRADIRDYWTASPGLQSYEII